MTAIQSYLSIGIKLFIFLPLILSSCKNVDVKKEVSAIDSLGQVVEKAHLHLKEINIENAKKIREEINTNMDFVKTHYQDTLSWDISKLLSDYHSIQKTLKHFLRIKEYLEKEIVYSNEQLKNLKHDIEKEIITKEQFNTYYEAEMKAVSGLKKEIKLYVDMAKEKIEKFNSINPKVGEVVKKFKEGI
ncbi:MAG: hypothetical protein ABII90_09540 [Bacteroidota bacterium]